MNAEPTPRTAAEIATIRPDLAIGAAVIVHPEWSRGSDPRPHGIPGTVVAHVRNGYVRVREDRYGTCCDYDTRDVVKRRMARCEPCAGMGREVYVRGDGDPGPVGSYSTRTCQTCEGGGRV